MGSEMCIRDSGCVCPVDCGKMPERIRMPFGMVGRMGPRMRQVVGFGIGPRERIILGANMGLPIVTNGDFVVYLRKSA